MERAVSPHSMLDNYSFQLLSLLQRQAIFRGFCRYLRGSAGTAMPITSLINQFSNPATKFAILENQLSFAT